MKLFTYTPCEYEIQLIQCQIHPFEATILQFVLDTELFRKITLYFYNDILNPTTKSYSKKIRYFSNKRTLCTIFFSQFAQAHINNFSA